MAERFEVVAIKVGGAVEFKAIGYIGDGTSFKVESASAPDRAEVEGWVAARIAGEKVEAAEWEMYSDD